MIKNFKNTLKASNGITLIALVITIIVLLILAGISISMLSGDNGILQKATLSKEKTERAQIIENAQIDILGQQAENRGKNISKQQLATILNKYFQTTEITSIPDEVSSEHDLVLKTIDERYTIKLSEIFTGTLSVQDKNSNLQRYNIAFSDTEKETGVYINEKRIIRMEMDDDENFFTVILDNNDEFVFWYSNDAETGEIDGIFPENAVDYIAVYSNGTIHQDNSVTVINDSEFDDLCKWLRIRTLGW